MDKHDLHSDGMLHEAAVSVVCKVDALRPKAVEKQHTPLSSASTKSQETVPSSVLADDVPGGESSESLEAEALPDTHCRQTGLSHTSLVEFGIQKCPKCNDVIQNDSMATPQASQPSSHAGEAAEIEAMVHLDTSREVLDLLKKLNRGVESMALMGEYWRQEHGGAKSREKEAEEKDESKEEESEKEEKEPGGESEEFVNQAAADHLAHQVEFVDDGNVPVGHEWRNDPLSIDEVKPGQYGGAVAIITSIVKTNIPRQGLGYQPAPERERILRAGVFHNPDVQVISLYQTMDIKSVPLIKVLESVVTYYPGLNLQGKWLSLVAPFHVLAHHIPELENFRDTFVPKVTTTASLYENNDDVTSLNSETVIQNAAEDEHSEVSLKHVDKILKFMKIDSIYSKQLEEELVRHRKDPPLCTFSMLWLLYKPGTTVYVSSSAGVEAFVISEVEADTPNPDGLDFTMEPKTTTLKLWNLGFDGTFVRRQVETEVIGSFDGERPIADLKIVPAAFADRADGGQIRGRLVELGRKWFGLLAGAPQQYYVGETMGDGRKKLDGRVVIDNDSYLKAQIDQSLYSYGERLIRYQVKDMGEDLKECPCNNCHMRRPHPARGFPWADYDVIDPTVVKSLELPESGNRDTMHRYILCSHQLWGFVLKSREWESLNVANCEEPKINFGAIEKLVMSGERKRMIKALVQKHTFNGTGPAKAPRNWGADYIESKGDGQVFLLHGGPGVGKTFTAECISELIGRPLLSLTSADLGNDESRMEKSLSNWFKLAEAWSAVMLLDEADVWLERRIVADLKRNSLVAVFLRCLEYYRGILFLTTNRVGTFDDAFVSRIHLAIYYEDLGEAERKQIWKQFFEKLEKERKNDIVVESAAKYYVLDDSEMRKIAWNGREIRNAFQTAVALAEYRFNFEGGKDEGQEMAVLDKQDFEQVCQMSVDFKKYLKAVHGGADIQDRAMNDRIRAPIE